LPTSVVTDQSGHAGKAGSGVKKGNEILAQAAIQNNR